MKLSKLLIAENFYKHVDSPKAMHGFCDELYKTYAKKLSMPALSGVKRKDLGEDTLMAVKIKNKLLEDYIGQPIQINSTYFDMFDEMKEAQNATYPYRIFNGMTHEMKHLRQIWDTREVTNGKQLDDKDILVALSRITYGLQATEANTKRKAIARRLNRINIKNRLKSILGIPMSKIDANVIINSIATTMFQEITGEWREDSYPCRLWEVDAREYANTELYSVFQENNDKATLPLLQDYTKHEAVNRIRQPGHIKLSTIPAELRRLHAGHHIDTAHDIMTNLFGSNYEEESSNEERKIINKLFPGNDIIKNGLSEKGLLDNSTFNADYDKFRQSWNDNSNAELVGPDR